MRFTPPPWRFDSNSGVIESLYNNEITTVIEARHGCSGDTWIEVRAANRLLIETAPELYHELMRLDPDNRVLAKARGEVA